MVELGQKVKDKITGFEGTATARIEFLNGCVQFLVRPKAATPKKGEAMEYPDGTYIDVEELDVVGKKKVKINGRKEPSGGVRKYPAQI